MPREVSIEHDSDSAVRAGDAQRRRETVRVLVIVLLCNAAVALTKFIVGASVGALALMADAVHSSLDASSNVIGLLGVWIADKPPDAVHPYGHRRFEALAAGAIGLMIGGGLVAIAREIYDSYVAGKPPADPTWAATGVVLATILINLAISAYEGRKGKALWSSVLTADSQHTLSDAAAALIVLVSFGGQALGLAHADVIAAMIVCVFIARTALGVLRRAVGDLVDTAQVDGDALRRVAMSVPGVLEAHRIRSRGPQNFVHVDLHIHLDGSSTLREAHQKTHRVVDAVKDAFPNVRDVVIHTEPAPSGETMTGEQDAESESPPSRTTSSRIAKPF